MYLPRSNNEWAFAGSIVGQAICVSTLDVYALLTYFNWITPTVYEVPRSYVTPSNFALIVLGSIYQAGLAIDALRMRNVLELYSVCVLNAGLLVFSVMRYFQEMANSVALQIGEAPGPRPFTNRSINHWGKVQPALLTSIGIVGICFVASCVLAFQLQREFRWTIYRHISGSLEMLRRYIAYQVLLVMIWVEAYFFIGFIILYGFVNVHYVQPEFGLTIALIPAIILVGVLTIFSIKHEHYIGAVASMLLRLSEGAYLISRIVELNGHGVRANTLLKDEMLFFAAVALTLSVSLGMNVTICIFNIGKGLKPLLQTLSWNKPPHEFQRVDEHHFSHRIELD